MNGSKSQPEIACVASPSESTKRFPATWDLDLICRKTGENWHEPVECALSVSCHCARFNEHCDTSTLSVGCYRLSRFRRMSKIKPDRKSATSLKPRPLTKPTGGKAGKPRKLDPYAYYLHCASLFLPLPSCRVDVSSCSFSYL